MADFTYPSILFTLAAATANRIMMQLQNYLQFFIIYIGKMYNTFCIQIYVFYVDFYWEMYTGCCTL